jgi:excisionase family DNA binding protein
LSYLFFLTYSQLLLYAPLAQRLEKNHMPLREFLTTKEVARYLRVNEYTVYRLVTQRKLPGVKVGSQWRFKRKVLERWLESQLKPPREQ